MEHNWANYLITYHHTKPCRTGPPIQQRKLHRGQPSKLASRGLGQHNAFDLARERLAAARTHAPKAHGVQHNSHGFTARARRARVTAQRPYSYLIAARIPPGRAEFDVARGATQQQASRRTRYDAAICLCVVWNRFILIYLEGCREVVAQRLCLVACARKLGVHAEVAGCPCTPNFGVQAGGHTEIARCFRCFCFLWLYLKPWGTR